MINEFLLSTSSDLNYNLALEEYLARSIDFSDRNLVLIYSNNTSAVLGKNQNVLKELNYSYYLQNSLTIGRRISGGGTVVHDKGNINFSFFEAHNFKKVNSYLHSTARLVEVINQLGVSCFLNSRNAILLDNGKKISGSAQFSCSNAILSHFTILYQSDLKSIDKILSKNPYDIKTKASESVSSTIDNLGNYLDLSQEDFINKSLEILKFNSKFDIQLINQEKVMELYRMKYAHPNYFYDTSCHGQIQKNHLNIDVSNGKISRLSGLTNSEEYIGKRLLYDEISSDNILWKYLL